MTWYRFYCTCGPGHQSRDEKYLFFEEEPNEDYLEDYWDLFFRDYDYPIGGWEAVDELPEKVRAEMIIDCAWDLYGCKNQLQLLGVTEQEAESLLKEHLKK